MSNARKLLYVWLLDNMWLSVNQIMEIIYQSSVFYLIQKEEELPLKKSRSINYLKIVQYLNKHYFPPLDWTGVRWDWEHTLEIFLHIWYWIHGHIRLFRLQRASAFNPLG